MSDHADTIRRILVSHCELGTPGYAALDALLAERQQAQETIQRQNGLLCGSVIGQLWAERQQLQEDRDEQDHRAIKAEYQLQQAIDALRDLLQSVEDGAPTWTAIYKARAALEAVGEKPQ